MREPVQESGLFSSLRRLLGTALELVQVRLGLLGTEIELEKRRLFDGLIWGAIGLLTLCIGINLLCGFIILLFWEGYRLAAVGTLALLFLAAGVLLVREARQRLHNPIHMFGASVEELRQDHAGLGATAQYEQR